MNFWPILLIFFQIKAAPFNVLLSNIILRDYKLEQRIKLNNWKNFDLAVKF